MYSVNKNIYELKNNNKGGRIIYKKTQKLLKSNEIDV